MNAGRQFDEADARVDRALRVEPRGLLGADRAGRRPARRPSCPAGPVTTSASGSSDSVDDLSVEGPEAVERSSAAHGDAESAARPGEPDRVVRLGEDRLGDVGADLLRVDVERGHHLDVADVVPAELDVHKTRDLLRRVGVLVVLQALDERRGAVADADDRDTNLVHEMRSLPWATASLLEPAFPWATASLLEPAFPRSASRRRFNPPVVTFLARSAAMSCSSHVMSDSVTLRLCSISARP